MINNEVLKHNLKEILLFLILTFAYFYSDLFYFLAHDEIPPYYGTAMHFYHASSFSEFYKLIINSSYTFGHPFLFPFMYGIGMKFWGLGSLSAKIFIVLVSTISIWGIYKISQLVFKNILYSFLLIFITFLSIVYTVNLPLFLGDTFLLPFCLFFTYFYLQDRYKEAIIIGMIAGLVRESFLLFFASFVLLELFQSFKTKSLPSEKILFISLTPSTSILWFLINKLKYGSFLHTFVKIDLESPNQSGIRLTFDFFMTNTAQFWKDIINIDPFILVNLVIFIFSFIHFKRLNDFQKKVKLLSLSIFLVTYFALSFFHGFYLRYLLYSYALIFMANLAWIQSIYQKRIKYFMIICLLILVRGIKNDTEAAEFGELATKRYEVTIKEYEKIEIDTDYIYLCFPYQAYICNSKYVYPNKPEKKCIEDLAQIPSGSLVTLVCRNPIDDYNINYEKYFLGKESKLIYRSNETIIENLSAWNYQF